MKLGQKSLPCALSTVGVKSEEHFIPALYERDFLRCKAMKDCAQNVHVFILWSRLDDPFAGLFKDLIIATETSGFRTAVLFV